MIYYKYDEELYTIEELEEEYREYVRDAVHFGESYPDWDEYLEDFEEVEVEDDPEDVKAMMWVDAWKNGDFDY